MTCTDHLLKRLSPPVRKARATNAGKKQPAPNAATGAPVVSKAKSGQKPAAKVELERYPVRVFLCAYMILGQPDAVFSSRGERESALAEAAAKLLPEFEALTGLILDGPSSSSPGPSSPTSPSPKRSKYDWPSDVSTTSALPSPRPFAAQLSAFDAAWCAYLYQFVAWKVKDAKVLEEDMIRMACQLEVSMLQKCRIPSGGNLSDLSHDAQAIRTQVWSRIFSCTVSSSSLPVVAVEKSTMPSMVSLRYLCCFKVTFLLQVVVQEHAGEFVFQELMALSLAINRCLRITSCCEIEFCI